MNYKKEKLAAILKSYKKVVVSLSGGLDSAVLLAFAVKTLGAENVSSITISSPYMLENETDFAKKLSSNLGVECIFSVFGIDESIKNNPKNRCYLCKKLLFTNIKQTASLKGFEYVCDGTNIDDLSDYRLGMKVLDELQIKSPFLEADMGKTEIKALAEEFSIPKFSASACLMTRFEHDTLVTEQNLKMVDNAETFIRSLGFNYVRVRVHNQCARVEIDAEDLIKISSKKYFSNIDKHLKDIGFKYVALDMCGYKKGAMNQKL